MEYRFTQARAALAALPITRLELAQALDSFIDERPQAHEARRIRR